MDKNHPEDHSKEKVNQEADVDRYERLQLAAERQIENVWRAYDKHASLIKWGVIVIVAVGGFFFWSNINGFKEEIRNNIQGQLTNVTARIESEFARMTNRIESKVQEESQKVDARIDQGFKKENIESLIEAKAQTNVDRITDKIITQTIHQQIDPSFSKITNQLAEIGNDLSHAKNTSEELGDVADLAITVVDALNDDRYAFNKLIRLRDLGTNKHQLTISRAIGTILAQLSQDEQDTSFFGRTLDWEASKFKPETATWEEYWKLWGNVGSPLAQSLLMQKISEQDRFSKKEKFGVYKAILQNGPSLKVLSRVCIIVNKEAHLNLNILGTPSYLKWVNTELYNLTISNATESIRTNAQDAAAYADRAEVYYLNEEFDRALSDFRKSISLNPTNADVLNSLAWKLATSTTDSFRDGKEAVKFATQACELAKWNTWSYVGTLAAAYAEAGNYEQAIKYQKQVMSMSAVPGDERPNQQKRLELFEQHKPTHESSE